jgi:hypothetical protein
LLEHSIKHEDYRSPSDWDANCTYFHRKLEHLFPIKSILCPYAAKGKRPTLAATESVPKRRLNFERHTKAQSLLDPEPTGVTPPATLPAGLPLELVANAARITTPNTENAIVQFSFSYNKQHALAAQSAAQTAALLELGKAFKRRTSLSFSCRYLSHAWKESFTGSGREG